MAELAEKDVEDCLFTDMLAKSVGYEMSKKFRTVRMSHCQGCRFNLLSQNDHDLCLLKLYDQVSELFDDLLEKTADDTIMDYFELLVFAHSFLKYEDVPYQYRNPYWRSCIFYPGMRKKIISFTLDKLKNY